MGMSEPELPKFKNKEEVIEFLKSCIAEGDTDITMSAQMGYEEDD